MGHRAGTSGPKGKGILFYPLRGSKGLGGLESDLGSKEAKPLHSIQEIQDAVSQIHSSQHQERGLPLLHRPDRGISSRPNTSGSPQVPPVLLYAQALSIQSPTLRPILGPSGLHQTASGASGAPQTVTGKSTMLPGRYNHPIRVVPVRTNGPPDHDTGPSRTRVLNQFQKESHHSIHQNHTLRRGDRFKPVQGLSVTGTQGQHQIPGAQDTGEQGGSTGNVVPTIGENDLMPGNHALGTAPLQTTPVVPTPIPEEEHECLRKEGEGPASHTSLTQMVGIHRHTQGIPVQGTSQTRPDHRRQHVRMGRTHANTHDSGTVVSIRPCT